MNASGDPETQAGGDRRKRALVIAAAVAIAVLLIAAGVWALFGRGSDGEADTAEKPEIEHARPTSPDDGSSESTPSVEATTSSQPGSGGTTPGSTPAGGTNASNPAFHRNPVVAYRFAGALHISGEDGSGAMQVAPSASGVFALSPDGRSLAYVDLTTRELVIADAATGATVRAGGAEQATPVWAPSSEWVLFTRAAVGSAATSSTYRTDVLRAQRSGGAPEVVASGRAVAVAPDARTVIVADDDGGTPAGTFSLEVMRDGRSVRRLRVPGPVTGLATDGTRAFVAVSHVGDASQAQDGIWVVPLDGAASARLVAAAPSTRPVETRSLMLSPDGSKLVYALAGDDGYSRASVVSASGGPSTELARRRDAYPLGWSADGATVYFIEGNAWQGETTALVRARPDGSAHTVVVQGAGL